MPPMRLYLDTAKTDEWDRLMPSGLFYGVTTNPLLAARAGLVYSEIDWNDWAMRLHDLGGHELHGQITGTTDHALEFAQTLYEIGAKVGIDTVVKIPLTADGIYLAPKIKALGGKILMTACYSAHQMIIAQSLCADYIAPYVGRMDDAGADIHAELRTIHSLSHSGPCRPLLASLRSVSQMTQMAALGHDCFTIAPAIADQLMHDPLTEQAAQEFEAAAKTGD
ncbi:MAG: transaldolase [Pseudomonadota bacterium]|jgi:transaldolase